MVKYNQKKNNLKFKNNYFQKPRWTFKQRMQHRKAYLKRRFRRLKKRANWLQRKYKKRFKTIRKLRRSSVVFLPNFLPVRQVSRSKKIKMYFKTHTKNLAINVMRTAYKLSAFKISKKLMRNKAVQSAKFNYFNK